MKVVGMDRVEEMRLQAQRDRARLWDTKFDLVFNGVVEMVDYEHPSEMKVNDLVIVCRGEYCGHVAVIEEVHLRRAHEWARLRRVWPVSWRGPAGAYWPTEYVYGSIAKLQPKVPQFQTVAEAEWWMHDARAVQVGQGVAFTLRALTTRDAGYEDIEYEGTLVEIDHLDIVEWYRYRPIAKGRFRVLHFDEDMQPQLTWVGELVRL